MSAPQKAETGIAIIGMAGRFPKARNVDEFWRNLCDGVECISFFTDDELAAAGVDVPKNNPNFVKARGILEDADLFDAAFFGVQPREAEVLDPQHRVFLECAWEALEDAGYDPARFDGAIGVFAGMGMNTYLAHNLLTHPDLIAQLNEHQLMLGNDKDYLPTRASYKLNLRGPGVSIQTACSTSLVAVCVACQNLLNYECDMALAGAVSITFPQKRGYLHQEGGIASPDGHCRAFDAKAAGTVAGEGVAIVVLKRLEDALADGDTIHAVIKGFAINNDGSNKIGYTAPSVEGQTEVIATAQAMAGFAPETISYVEAHGTATPLGDPIEIEGLTKAFRLGTTAKNFCAIGSVKSNIGHLDTAAGVAGLIKTALALHHKKLPRSLHFESPNPKIDFAASPFYVNARPAEWKRGETPRRAGVSSFGIGGTNSHVVLEEAPVPETSSKSRPVKLLLLSAKTEGALDKATAILTEHLNRNPAVNLADAAYTLQVGRQEFAHRRMLVCREASDVKQVFSRLVEHENPPVVFMFPGQGAQHVNMGRELYEDEPVFRQVVDSCCEMLKPQLRFDLRSVLYPDSDQTKAVNEHLKQTSVTQPALFVIEYALARLWMSWGVKPEAIIGHSIGEYVAACLAGVFSLEDALALVTARGRMMQEMPAGTMLAVRLPEKEVLPLLNDQLSLAAVNGTALCVVSGPDDAVTALQRQLAEREVACTPLQTSHAFHSAMVQPILKPFTDLAGKVKLSAPQIPYISNVTGTWITAAQATDPTYWAKHLRQTVRFADGLGELFKNANRILLEVGPGQTLGNLAKQHPARDSKVLVFSSLRRANDTVSDLQHLLTALGQLWLGGMRVDWHGFYGHERRRRVRLPTYPFERKRYFIEPARSAAVPSRSASGSGEAVQISQGPIAVEPAADGESRAPRPRKDRLASELKALLGELSGRDLAGVNGSTTFVEMGFDSLFFTQASLAIEKRFNTKVAFRQLMQELSTVEALAAQLDSTLPPGQSEARATEAAVCDRRNSRVDESPEVADRPDREARVPLTDAQKEIWFASQMSDGASCAYNETRLLHFRGPLRAKALFTALQQLVDRHEALRTTISPPGDEQLVHARLKLDVALIDLSPVDAAQREARLDALDAGEASQPFDLVNGPLVRAQLVQLTTELHVLLLTIHHVVCDGRSWGVLLNDLARLYSAGGGGANGEFAAPLQLSEFAREQACRDASPERAAAEAYWLKQFADGAPVLELPTDQPRPSTWTFNGARECSLINPQLTRRLKQLSAQQNCTLFTTLLAAYYLLLHKLTHQNDIVVGIPTTDSAMVGGDTLIGHCINFLPVYGRIADDLAFAKFLAAVKETFLEAHEHQHCTFGSLIQKLHLLRDPSRMPLVSVTFNVDRLRELPKFLGLDTEVTSSRKSLNNFDLSFNATEIGDELRLGCRFNASLFSPQTIQRWLRHFETLLEEIVAAPDRCVADLSLLSSGERKQILIEWNNTRAEYPCEKCVHQLFEEQVERAPETVAVEFNGQSLTYRELNDRANELARQLPALGVGPDVPVGIAMERSPDMVTCVLAVLKAGGAYVPLDPAYPIERLQLMIANARVPLVLTGGDFKLQNSDCRLLRLGDVTGAAPSKRGLQNPRSAILNPQSSNLAYIIHTSGSTGVPKGVAIEHRSAVNFISWAQREFTRAELAGVLFSTSLCFDLSVFELFVTLSSGGKVIIAQNALELPKLPAKSEVTLINTVPSAIAELLRLDALPPSVRAVNLAGEPLKPALVDRLYGLSTVKKVRDLYGPTETTTYSTCALRRARAPETVGRPIANTQIYILDARRQPVPVGVVGEIYIGGEGLARGYLHRPDLTTDRFVPNPFSDEADSHFYRTGDLARWLPDGNIEFLGRADHQVKIRGFRVELGEVETVLAQHPDVHECVVMASEDSPGEKRLSAYVVSKSKKEAGKLRDFLKTKLPDYMIPSAFVFLDALPRTPNGKVNRRALPSPDPALRDVDKTFVAPSTPTEKALAEIWCEVLRVERVGTLDNFFELGGHSLLMTQVIARVREAFQVELPMRRFFGSPIVADLSAAIEELLVEDIGALSEEEARRLAHSAT